MTPAPGGKASLDGQSSAPAGGSFLRHPPQPSPGPENAAQKPRRGSTASSILSVRSIPSVGGSLDTSTGWVHPVFESGRNAISTLLEPPIVRTGLQPHAAAPASSAHRPPTSRDIPPITLTNIPHIDPADFKPYLARVSALYEQLQRAKENDDDEPSTPTTAGGTPGRRGSRFGEWPDAHEEGYLRPASDRMQVRRKGSSASITSISSLDSPGLQWRPGPGHPRKTTAQGPPPLNTIPNVYFEEDFHLENPRTFDIVSERSEVVRQPRGEEKGGAAAAATATTASTVAATANGSATAPPRKALATNAILQEKLSWYMDTIEMHLISSISTASTTFFSALGSLRELHAEAAESVDRIKALRRDLRALDEEMAATGLTILQKRRRRGNMEQLNGAVRQLRQIVDGVVGCEALVDAGEVEKALDHIDSIEWLMAGERQIPAGGWGVIPVQPSPGLIDLRGASALQGVGGDMETLRFRTGKIYENKFQTQLLEDLRRHVDSVSVNEVLMRWSSAAQRARGGQSRVPSVFPTYMAGTEELRALIRPNLLGLSRAKHITIATTGYREAVLREVRSIVRRPLPSSHDDDDGSTVSASTASGGRTGRSRQEKSLALAHNLHAMGPEDAEEMLSGIYVRFAEATRRLTTQAKLMLDVAGGPGGSGIKSPLPRSPLSSPSLDREAGRREESGFEVQEELHLAFELPRLLGQAVDTAHDRIAKILRVRAEQTKHLPPPWFLRYYTLNLLFVNECEAISGQSGAALKALVTGHIKDFVHQHGTTENQKLAAGMEPDRWGVRDFADADAAVLGEILSCSTRDPPSWAERTSIWQPYDASEEADGRAAVAETNGAERKEKTRTAVIESQPFLLPQSAILCLHGITRFLRLISAIPLLTADIATTLVAYLQLFNSRCTQLILGAGATRSAGLKNIAAKHLSLASQALAFVATLIPHMREFVRRNLGSSGGGGGGGGSGNLMGEFDKARHLMQEHQESIYQKIVDIMRNRAGAAAREMMRVDWDAVPTASSVHAYVETLSKDTTTLHRVLTKNLPEPSVQMIMLPVFESYREQFGQTLQMASIHTEAGRESMLRDIDYIISEISKLDGFGDTGNYLLSIIRAKEVIGGDDRGSDGDGKAERSPPQTGKGAEGNRPRALANGGGQPEQGSTVPVERSEGREG